MNNIQTIQILPALNYVAPTITVVGTSSGLLIPVGLFQKYFCIYTLPGSATNVWLSLNNGAAVSKAGAFVAANGGGIQFGLGGFPMPTANINAITDGGVAQSLAIWGA